MIVQRTLATRATTLGEKRQVRVICSTQAIGRDALVVMSAGIELDAFRKNPVILWQHDPTVPIARAVTISTAGENLEALVQFPPEAASPKAREVYELIRAGIVSGLSLGFEPIKVEPLKEGGDVVGTRISRCELLEVSFVSIPAVPNALVTGRSASLRAAPRRSMEFHRRHAAELAKWLRADRACQSRSAGGASDERDGSGARHPCSWKETERRVAELRARLLAEEGHRD